ncbi:ABC transporter ATP-binding protein [Haloparvum sedimenti]|uniref:ABC transporter ATP-binding protein n=1 Tax=Haloparvum sedimenti TaxID=1678448 RepID=UPI0009B5BB62|nr:ABC transporter ATP-binding protein [Haloparvum sedimenti]
MDANTTSTGGRIGDGSDADALLTVEELTVRFDGRDGPVDAVDGVSFALDRGETVCLVGESGSGKTATCEAITGLVAEEGATVGGRVTFDGRRLTDLGPGELREVRGDRIAHVFQDPEGALDPVYTVGEQIVESIRYHRDVSKNAARERAIDLLEKVGIPEPATRIDEYPHEFSGGMKQRALVAMALSSDPDVLIADEPTTALDVTIEAGILDLFSRLQAEEGLGVLFVTHDFGVVAEVADRVVVLYGGKAMERGGVEAIFDRPAHPYTRALLSCLPGRGGLDPIGGEPVDPRDPPDGCRFEPRCSHATGACRTGGQSPEYAVEAASHLASCVYYGPDHDRSELERGDGGDGPRTPDDAGTKAPSDAGDAAGASGFEFGRDPSPSDGGDR